MTEQLLFPLIILAALAVVASLLKAFTQKSKDKVYTYQKRPGLLTQNELKFYRELLPLATTKNMAIFAKVRIADLLEPQKGSKNWQSSFNKIAMKHVDFVLCDKNTLKPILALEIDDKTHDRKDRQERDTFVDQAMQTAKMQILHVRDIKELSQKINSMSTATK